MVVIFIITVVTFITFSLTFPSPSRLFGAKCDKCLRSFGKSDYVMRAKNKIFHLECFRLEPG